MKEEKHKIDNAVESKACTIVNLNLDLLKLFIITVEEYKRFSMQLDNHKITDSYDEFDYIKINAIKKIW